MYNSSWYINDKYQKSAEAVETNYNRGRIKAKERDEMIDRLIDDYVSEMDRRNGNG